MARSLTCVWLVSSSSAVFTLIYVCLLCVLVSGEAKRGPQMVVSPPVWVLRTKLGSCGRTASAFFERQDLAM